MRLPQLLVIATGSKRSYLQDRGFAGRFTFTRLEFMFIRLMHDQVFVSKQDIPLEDVKALQCETLSITVRFQPMRGRMKLTMRFLDRVKVYL